MKYFELLETPLVFYHGTNERIFTFRPSEGKFQLLGNGIYFYRKKDSARRYGNLIYQVKVPKSVKIAPLDYRLSKTDLQNIFPDKEMPDMVGIFNPIWWGTDGWNIIGEGRAETIEKVASYIMSQGFDGMLADYPNGGLVLVVWRKYELLRPLLTEGVYGKPSGNIIAYHGCNGIFDRSRKMMFLSDEREIAHQYGTNVYKCSVDLGKNADLTYNSSPIFSEFNISKTLQKTILLGELWKHKSVEMELIKRILQSYDSITLFDTSSENYDDSDGMDFGTTYIVKDASKQVRLADLNEERISKSSYKFYYIPNDKRYGSDMDTRLNVDMNSLDYFDDIDSEYSVYTKHDKCYIYDKKEKCLIGYAHIHSSFLQGRQHIEVDEIALRPAYRGKNIAYKFYLMLLSLGYIVASGADQTKGGASIWKRLMNDPSIKVTSFGLHGDIDPADVWHDHYARLKAEMVSESVMVDEIQNLQRYDLDPAQTYNKYIRCKSQKSFLGSYSNIDVFCKRDGRRIYFLLKNKEDEPLGSAILVKSLKYEWWYVNEMGMLFNGRGFGYGYGFYKFLLSNGFKLISGSHTPDGKKVWQRLMKDKDVSVKAMRLTFGDDGQGRDDLFEPSEIDDPWSDDDVHLTAEKASTLTNENKMVDEIERASGGFSDRDVKSGIDYAVTVPLKIIGIIDKDIVVSKGKKGNEDVFLISKKREAMGYANGIIKDVALKNEKIEVLELSDISLYERFQGKGIGLKFYKLLLENGYAIMSGKAQTNLGEKLWRKLIKLPSVSVTAVKRTKKKYEVVELGVNDPWGNDEIQLILRFGQEITEDLPAVAAIEPQPKGLERCTVVSTNAILSHFKKSLIKSGAIPTTAKACFDVLNRSGLNIEPDYVASEKKMTVKTFVSLHQNGVWFIGTTGHAMALVEGLLYDTENKGIDNRIIKIVAKIVR